MTPSAPAGQPATRPFSSGLRRGALAASAGAALAALLAAAPAPAAILPAWVLVGSADVALDAGIHDIAGTYSFTLEGQTQNISLSYKPDATITGGGLINGADGLTIFSLSGRQARIVGGPESITLQEPARRPRFTFTGEMAPDGGDLAGTFTRSAGYLGFTGTASGPMTIPRVSPATGSGTFRLQLKTTTDSKGRVKGGLASDGVSEDRARITVFGGKVLLDGRIKGRIRTNGAGVTTGTVAINGPKWSVKLRGPLDVDGFHAVAAVKGGGFSLKGVPVLLPAQAGPEPPPPPPPPPPKNQLGGATATITAGQVHIVRGNVPTKFFGAKATLDVTFPGSAASGTFHADPANASGAEPRRFLVKIGSLTYGTATAPADVSITVQNYTTTSGGTIQLLCTGKVATGSKTKKVSLILVATVQ